jgi:hypothetical protein
MQPVRQTSFGSASSGPARSNERYFFGLPGDPHMLWRFHCSWCGNAVAFLSRPKSRAEKYLFPLFLLRPVRCGECFRRQYRPVFVSALEAKKSNAESRQAAAGSLDK